MIKISALPAAGALTGAELVPVVKSGVTSQTTSQAVANLGATGANLASVIHAATGKTTPVNADELALVDSAASNGLKKLTWANLKATVWGSFGALIAGGTDKATPVDTDTLPLSDSAASDATKKLTWADVKATLKLYFDTLYVGATSQRTIQVIEATPYTTYTSYNVAIPRDDTIPQNTEGTEIVTAAITPTSATNRLRLECVFSHVTADAARDLIAALFQDTTANALAVAMVTTSGANGYFQLTLVHEMAAGTTSATTFKVRVGPGVAGVMYVNGSSTTRNFGGIAAVRFSVMEIKV